MFKIKTLLMLSMLAFGSTAYAQDSVDIHGFQLAPSDGDLHDGLSTWRGEAHEQHSFGVSGLFEYAAQPLARYQQTGDTVTRTILIDDLTALNLGLFYAPHERISLTAAAPLYMTVDSVDSQSGAGLGDIRLAGSVGLLLPQEDRVSVGLSAVPFLDVPGFYSTQSQLGLDGFAGGGLVALSVTDSDRWDVSGNVGVQFTPEIEFYNLRGEERLVTAVSGAYSLTEDVAIRGEWIFRPTLSKNDVPWSDSPMEVMASLRGHTGDNLGWTFGGATALDQGAGAATWRVFAGLDLAFGARHTEEHYCGDCVGGAVVILPWTEDGEPIVDSKIYIAHPGSEDIIQTVPNTLIYVGDRDVSLIHVVIPNGVEVADNVIYLSMPVFFDFDKSDLRFPEGEVALQLLAEALMAHPDANVVIHGHTDERGSEEYNVLLSERRAETVENFLVDELGVDPERLNQLHWGEEWSYGACGEDEDCHQMERRVDFEITE